MLCTLVRAALALLVVSPLAVAQDWGNYGGNAARNGQSPVGGPVQADLQWSNTDDFSIISWHPFIHDERVFTVREAGFPATGGAANDAVVAYDLATGGELWRTTLPYGGDPAAEWIAWIGGARNGRVYASRSDNDGPAPLRALDATDGSLLWTTSVSTRAWAHDGVVFADNGDLLVGDFQTLYRIRATDGGVVWSTARSCPVSGNCGAATANGFLYVDEPVAGPAQVLSKYDAATGALLYSSPPMIGFTDQNSPFVSPDGTTVYMSRTQDNPITDFLYAFEDTGAAFVAKWDVPVRWTTSHEHGVGLDGSIYTFSVDDEFVRLHPETGAVIGNAGVLSPIGSPNLSPKTVVDANGRVYVSNGWASTPASDGRLWAFSADLSTELFSLQLDRPNAGGPALGADGTLVVCDRSGVYAYRSAGSWADVGGGTPGQNGTPTLLGEGSLIAGTGVSLSLSNAPANKLVLLWIALVSTPVNLWGGTIHAFPFSDQVLTASDGSGAFSGATSWPPGVPSGTQAWFQFLVEDPSVVFGITLSNAVRATTPL